MADKDPAYLGSMRLGYCRLGVVETRWDRLVTKLESVGGLVCDVTHRSLYLGERDDTTGWRSKNYATSTVEGVMVHRSSSHLAMAAGVYVRLDAVFFTSDGFQVGDELLLSNGEYYEVQGVRDYYVGNGFSHRELDLVHLPFHL